MRLTKLALISSIVVMSMVSSHAIGQRRNEGRPQRGRRSQSAQTEALKVGQLAPTFTISSLDGKSTTTLASFRDEKPVLMFYGSYT